MSDVFADYSRYYDLLYHDKDYQGEVDYVVSLVNRLGSPFADILDLGCGTGRHAELMVAQGATVLGVERSESMRDQAVQRANKSSDRFQVLAGDARTFRIKKSFDTVLSLFHVVSYQTNDSDALALFTTASQHLKPSGIFLFDVWHGPAVVNERPAIRIKRISNDLIDVLRIAEPTMLPGENRVDVDYTVFVTDRPTQEISRFSEHHAMRYYFAEELEALAQQTGMEMLHSEAWMTGNDPSCDTWGVTYAVRKL